MMKRIRYWHGQKAFVRAQKITMWLTFAALSSIAGRAQIVTVLTGDNCLDQVTLNETDIPLLPARCQSAGVCQSANPFAGISIIIASQYTCTGTPVTNIVASSAKVG